MFTPLPEFYVYFSIAILLANFPSIILLKISITYFDTTLSIISLCLSFGSFKYPYVADVPINSPFNLLAVNALFTFFDISFA